MTVIGEHFEDDEKDPYKSMHQVNQSCWGLSCVDLQC